MSSPNHFTSDIEDAFFSMNILNYTLVSPDYFPTSVGSNSFNFSENSNIIPSVVLPLYNNPYLKDVQAIYAKELPISSPDPITPPAILTLSLILPPSLLFNPRYFFIPEELLSPKKRIYSPSSSSTTLFTSFQNQTYKMYLKHHEKQVEDILNYLDELYLHRIERMEEGRINEPPVVKKRKLTRIQKLSTYLLQWHRRDLLTASAWLDTSELVFSRTNCAEEDIETLLLETLYNDSLSCQEQDEFYNLVVKGNDLKTYIRRFQELAVLCPNMVPNAEKLVEVFINGLPRSIEGNVTASKPQNLEEAINIAHRLIDQIIKHDSVLETNDRKRKLEDERNIINNNNYQNNYNNNNRNNDYH
ncbi:hypothetical protein Tco_1311304 [Tanacetum coccineum]